MSELKENSFRSEAALVISIMESLGNIASLHSLRSLVEFVTSPLMEEVCIQPTFPMKVELFKESTEELSSVNIINLYHRLFTQDSRVEIQDRVRSKISELVAAIASPAALSPPETPIKKEPVQFTMTGEGPASTSKNVEFASPISTTVNEDAVSRSPTVPSAADFDLYRTPQKERTIYVGGMVLATTKDDIKARFSQHGRIREVRIPHRRSENCPMFAFVEYDTKDAADSAVIKEDRTYFSGRLIFVHKDGDCPGKSQHVRPRSRSRTRSPSLHHKRSRSRAPHHHRSRSPYRPRTKKHDGMESKVFVHNLLESVTEFEVWEYFEKYGKIRGINMSMNASPCYCTIQFKKREDAREAIAKEHNQVIFGKTVVVDYSKF